jgi:hypothetical protein
MAARGAGLRGVPGGDGRYRLLLGKYRQPSKRPVTSCKQLNNYQIGDFLAICESMGWRCPGKNEDHFRAKLAKDIYGQGAASLAIQQAIIHLAGDLGWTDQQLNGFIERMTAGKASHVAQLSPGNAHKTVEALKAMVCRQEKIEFKDLKEMREHFEGSAKDGQTNQTCQV